MADDLLAVTGLESRTGGHDHVGVDLAKVVLAAEHALERAVAVRQLDLSFEVGANPVFVRGDATNLESLMTNLLDNAIS